MSTTTLAACLAAAAALGASSLGAQSIDFRSQTLRAGGDSLEIEVGRLTVPSDHTQPARGTMELGIVRLRSTSDQPGAPIVYLAGGPGGSGTAAIRIPHYLALFQKLRSVADVILLDQRGTGTSTPNATCVAQRSPPADLFASGESLAGWYSARIRDCVAEWRAKGVTPEMFDTERSADDLDVLRRALGADDLQLLGFSYGTHLGLSVIRRHGEHIARAVLAGVEGPDDNWKLPSVAERQIDRLDAMAARSPAVARRLPAFKDSLRAILERAEREPWLVEVRDAATGQPVRLTIGADALRYLIARDLGDTNDLPLFPAWVWTMTQEDDVLLARFAEKRYNELRYVSLMGMATDCASGASEARKARVREEAPRMLLRDAMNMFFETRCAAVGRVQLGDAFRSPITSDVPVLFVSGTLDTQTPPEQLEAVRRGFSRSAHLIVQNAGHESTLPVPGVQDAIVRFFGGEMPSDTSLALPAIEFRGPPARR